MISYKHRRRLLVAMMVHLTTMAAGRQIHRINVADYGAVPDSKKDAVPSIQKALAACKKERNVILVFPKGRYDLYPDSAVKKEYFLSNTSSETECPSKWKTIGLLLENMQDLSIDGQGSIWIFHGKMITFALDHSRNITLKNLEIDFERPTMSEFTITRSAPEAIEIKVHPDSWYRLDSGRLTWYGEGWVAQNAHCIRIDTPTHQMYYANDEYNQLIKASITQVADSRLLFRGNFDTARFHTGDVYTVRDPIRDEVGALILYSKDTHLANISMHYMHGLGILSQYSENISLKDVSVEPRKGSGRWIASFADGMHFSGCKGRIGIEHCRFNGLHDDAINVHGTHLKIIKIPSAHQLVLRFMHPQTYGFQAFFEKDSIAFIHPETLATYAFSKVSGIKRLSDREVLLTLDKPIPSAVKVNDVVENTTWTPELTLRHSLITGSNTRGLLVTTRRKVLIEENEFRRLGMQAILIADDALSWFESGPVKDVLIRNNTFTMNGHLIYPQYAIVIAPENHRLTNTPVHRNIRIENNRFYNRYLPVLAARSVEGLTFINNTLHYASSEDSTKKFLLVDCKAVDIRNNRYVKTP